MDIILWIYGINGCQMPHDEKYNFTHTTSKNSTIPLFFTLIKHHGVI